MADPLLPLSGAPRSSLVKAEKLLQLRKQRYEFATKYHHSTRGEPLDFKNYPHIKALYNSVAAEIAVQGSTQCFKAQPLTSKVHTPGGWKLMGDLKVGDLASTPDGGQAPITQVQPQGKKQIYKIVLSDGREVEACADHLWQVRRKNDDGTLGPEGILTTSEISCGMSTKDHSFVLPTNRPIQKPERDLPVDPYQAGVNTAHKVALVHTEIPEDYLEGALWQRLAFLQGILDTSGIVKDEISLYSRCETWIKQVQHLVLSLGGTTTLTKAGNYRLDIYYEAPQALFQSYKKIAASETLKIAPCGPTIKSISAAGIEEAQCIVIDHPDHLYLTDGYVVTHNSEWLVIDHLAAASIGLQIFFVLPKYDLMKNYVQNRVDRPIGAVREYKQFSKDGSFDNVNMKAFGKGVIKYVGSNVVADMREYPADCLYVEEVDQCNTDNLKLAVDRLQASPFKFKRRLGNPSHVGSGINAAFQESSQQAWHTPCDKCGEYSELDWFTTVVESVKDADGSILEYRLRDREWEPGIRRDIRLVCPKCGEGTLQRGDQSGKWVAKKQSVIEGFHISQLCSELNSVSSVWQAFQKGLSDPVELQHFYNSYLGLPFTAEGNKVTESTLERATGDYDLVIKPDCAHIQGDGHYGPCSMGVDVGGNLDVKISYVPGDGTRQMVYIGKVKRLETLYELIERYNVEKCVIDSMPETKLVQDFQDEAMCDVWACRYSGEGSDRRMRYDVNERIVTVDRTETLDRSFSDLKTKKTILPKNFRSIFQGEFTREMTGPVRGVVEDDKGNKKYEWSKCKDHQRHADGYDMLAAKMMSDSMVTDIYID